MRVWKPLTTLLLGVSFMMSSLAFRGLAQQESFLSNTTEQVLIILDASGSMAEKIEGDESKMAAAKRVIRNFIDKVPENVALGLRVYGNGHHFINPCRSTKRMVAMGLNNHSQIEAALPSIFPQGATPISFSLIQAMNKDFLGGRGKKRIVLVSDGGETCDSDPCAVALDIVKQRIDVEIDVVGFGNLNQGALRQLRCVSAATYGQFSQANTSAELANALGKFVKTEASVQGQLYVPEGQSKHVPAQTVPSQQQVPVGHTDHTWPEQDDGVEEIDLSKF